MVPSGVYNAQVGIYYKYRVKFHGIPTDSWNIGIARPALSHVLSIVKYYVTAFPVAFRRIY